LAVPSEGREQGGEERQPGTEETAQGRDSAAHPPYVRVSEVDGVSQQQDTDSSLRAMPVLPACGEQVPWGSARSYPWDTEGPVPEVT
jgi:hypothetical protein